jgi:hypothetical protein
MSPQHSLSDCLSEAPDHALIRGVLKGDTLPNFSVADHLRLIEMLRSHRDSLANRSMIRESELADAALNRVRQLYSESLKIDFQQHHQTAVQQRLLNAARSLHGSKAPDLQKHSMRRWGS